MKYRSKTSLLLATALLAALLAVCAQIILPLGPVPFSMAVFAVFFAGAMLPPLYAAGCVAVYLALGLVGVPVFSGFSGGPQVLLGPTGGYLLGYFALALAATLAMRFKFPFWLQILAALGGIIVCYLCGTCWFMLWSGSTFWASILLCCAPFFLPDIAKAALALALARLLQKRMNRGRAAE